MDVRRGSLFGAAANRSADVKRRLWCLYAGALVRGVAYCFEEPAGSSAYLVDGGDECLLVASRRRPVSTHLAHVLEGGCANLFIGW
jgi:hypothetical protein